MRDDQVITLLGAAPKTYDPSYVEMMFRRIEIHLQTLAQRGPIKVSTINISNLPTSATGLRPGDLWNDTGTVKVVT